MATEYVASRFLSLSRQADGTLLLYNTLTGAIGATPTDRAAEARAALKRSSRIRGPLAGIHKDLADGGFLVSAEVDERRLIDEHYRAKYNEEALHLIVLPTEQCNFRCVYCYESFQRGTMRPEIREGLKNFVASQPRLKRLRLEWFGGEPLLAADVVIELTHQLSEHCRRRGVTFTSGVTTNGSLLTENIARQLILAGVRFFQITLDGPRDDHDKTRVLQNGGGTFDLIVANLRMLKTLEYPFVVGLRHNFSHENVEHLETFIELVQHELGGDPRFTLLFEAVAKWGGPNDTRLNICEGMAVIEAKMRAMNLAVEAGFAIPCSLIVSLRSEWCATRLIPDHS